MKNKLILLVDDDAILAEIIVRRIKESGYDCMWAHDGVEGVKLMRELSPDLVLLDIVMPAMNGYEVLDIVYKDAELSKIPVIVISNSGQPVEIEKILLLGVKDYIVKAHFTPEEVLRKVVNILGSSNAESGAQKEHKNPENSKVLIIEDDAMLLEIASERFRQDHFQVLTATDGHEGFEVAKREHPDLILLDIIMPGPNGFEVLRQLKAEESIKSIPVIIFSNLAQGHEIALAKKLGAVDFLVKANFTPAQVVERVKEYL